MMIKGEMNQSEERTQPQRNFHTDNHKSRTWNQPQKAVLGCLCHDTGLKSKQFSFFIHTVQRVIEDLQDYGLSC